MNAVPLGNVLADAVSGLRPSIRQDAAGRRFCTGCQGPLEPDAPVCWPCTEAANRAADLAEARLTIAKGTRALMSAIPPWPFADVRNAAWCSRVHPRCCGVAERWEPSRGPICLLGPSEAGKTSALVALAKRLRSEALTAGDVTHPIVGAVWVSALDLCRTRRELRFGSVDLELDAAKRARVLFLDELGQEDAAPSWLLELLDERYRKGRPTLSTSGLTRAQLDARYGSGAARRLEQPGGQFVDLHGGDGG